MEGSNHIKALLNGTIDIYLGALNGLDNENLTSKVLYEDDMVLLVNKSHPLAGKGRLICQNAELSLLST